VGKFAKCNRPFLGTLVSFDTAQDGGLYGYTVSGCCSDGNGDDIIRMFLCICLFLFLKFCLLSVNEEEERMIDEDERNADTDAGNDEYDDEAALDDAVDNMKKNRRVII
jgi:hypothetical protein